MGFNMKTEWEDPLGIKGGTNGVLIPTLSRNLHNTDSVYLLRSNSVLMLKKLLCAIILFQVILLVGRYPIMSLYEDPFARLIGD
jgi:hypothetical protein